MYAIVYEGPHTAVVTEGVEYKKGEPIYVEKLPLTVAKMKKLGLTYHKVDVIPKTEKEVLVAVMWTGGRPRMIRVGTEFVEFPSMKKVPVTKEQASYLETKKGFVIYTEG